jgi:hypothetical protein
MLCIRTVAVASGLAGMPYERLVSSLADKAVKMDIHLQRRRDVKAANTKQNGGAASRGCGAGGGNGPRIDKDIWDNMTPAQKKEVHRK